MHLRQVTILFLLMSVFAATVVRGAELNEAQFTAAFAEMVVEVAPGARAQIVAPKHVEIELKDGSKSTAFLENAYLVYQQDTSQLQVLLKDYAENAIRTANADKSSAFPILPVLRSFDYFGSTGQELLSSSSSGLLHIPVSNEVGIFFVRDEPKSIYYLQNEDLVQIRTDKQELLLSSLRELSKQSHPVQVAEGFGFSVVVGDDYASSLMLSAEFWKKFPFPYKGRKIVIPVSRTMVLVTGEDDDEAVKNAREFAIKMFETEPYAISTKPLVLNGNTWEGLP